MNALSTEIAIQDTDEIAEAKWCDITELLNDENNSVFIKGIVKQLHAQQGLQPFELDTQSGINKKHEVLLASELFKTA